MASWLLLMLLLLFLSLSFLPALGFRILEQTNATVASNVTSSGSNISFNAPMGVGSPPKQAGSQNKTGSGSFPPPESKPVKNETTSLPPRKIPPTAAPKKEGNKTRGVPEAGKSPVPITSPRDLCAGVIRCHDNKDLVSCMQSNGSEMQGISLLIQNKGNDVLHATIHTPAFLKVENSKVTVGKREYKLVSIKVLGYGNQSSILPEVVIDAGSGKCVLNVSMQLLSYPSEKQSLLDGLSYYTAITPVNGIYVFIIIIIIILSIGGTWTCYKFCSRRRHDAGIRYQELEMNNTGTDIPSVTGRKSEIEGSDEWDEVWDDNWEDAEVGMSSSTAAQSLSSNGLAARKTVKDGWDTWED
eukprot:TRINITY_DN5242_c0_g1_i1.p1 TRINITY_DN5242_c0_g1~~TRINITY_DN5242_c0_g1_i1.p1  ORF type:complete len:356 (-),score=65.58 TRINITY_DN5242_c0_g1_i1:226-1293(-)